MWNYSYFAMPRTKTVNHELENLSYIGSKLWDSIPSYMKKIDSINEFKHVIKTWKPDICAHADFVKFVYKILGILVSKKKKQKKKQQQQQHTRVQKLEYYNRFSPFVLRYTFTFPCLVICWNLWNLFGI